MWPPTTVPVSLKLDIKIELKRMCSRLWCKGRDGNVLICVRRECVDKMEGTLRNKRRERGRQMEDSESGSAEDW